MYLGERQLPSRGRSLTLPALTERWPADSFTHLTLSGRPDRNSRSRGWKDGSNNLNGASLVGNSGATGQLYLNAGSSGAIVFQTGNTLDSGNPSWGTGASERMRIKSDGKVGVGTNDPGEKLEVSGNGKIRDGYLELNEVSTPAAPGANGARLFIRDDGSGKSQLCVIFNSGSAQCFAAQP